LRVVSLLPSATEIVCALGHGDELVGRSSECDHPLAVRRLPSVMVPRRWDADAPSRDIDARVSATRAQGESLYVLDIELLRTLRPDLLITQDLCGVCSVTGPEVEEACARAGVRPSIVSLTPRTLDEVWSSVEVVAHALDDPGAGAELAGRLKSASLPTRSDRPPSVGVLEWLDPPILAGLGPPRWSSRPGAGPSARARGNRASERPGPTSGPQTPTWSW